jgi:hypothetical protein
LLRLHIALLYSSFCLHPVCSAGWSRSSNKVRQSRSHTLASVLCLRCLGGSGLWRILGQQTVHQPAAEKGQAKQQNFHRMLSKLKVCRRCNCRCQQWCIHGRTHAPAASQNCMHAQASSVHVAGMMRASMQPVHTSPMLCRVYDTTCYPCRAASCTLTECTLS